MKVHLLLDLDGTLVRRQLLERRFFEYNRRIEADTEFEITPEPDIRQPGMFCDEVDYLRPGLVEFLTWAYEFFNGRVYIFTASSKEGSTRFWKLVREKFPTIPELQVFGYDDCKSVYKKDPKFDGVYSHIICKNILELIKRNHQTFKEIDLENDRWLLVDDRSEVIDDDFTRGSSLIVPPYNPIIQARTPITKNLTVLVDHYFYINPDEKDWEKIKTHQPGFHETDTTLEILRQSILEKIPLLPPIPNPVDKELELARTRIRDAIDNGRSYIFTCSEQDHWSRHFETLEEAEEFIQRYKFRESYSLIKINEEDESNVEIIKSQRKALW